MSIEDYPGNYSLMKSTALISGRSYPSGQERLGCQIFLNTEK